jgi:hypothetical protein
MNLTIFLLVSSHYRTHHNNHNAKPPCSLVSYLPFSLPWYYCKQDIGNLRRTTRYRNYFRYYKFLSFLAFPFLKENSLNKLQQCTFFTFSYFLGVCHLAGTSNISLFLSFASIFAREPLLFVVLLRLYTSICKAPLSSASFVTSI